MAWYMRTPEDTNSTDVYLPKTTLEKAGCLGVGSAVATDPNLVFASIIAPGNEQVPYPTGIPGGGAYIVTPVAVETTATDVIAQRGPDTIVNGDFSVDANWTKGVGWTIAGGVAVATAAATAVNLEQAQTLVAGVSYQITYTIVSRTAGGVRPFLRSGAVYGPVNTVVGTYTNIIVAGAGNTLMGFQVSGGPATLTLDNVTLERVY